MPSSCSSLLNSSRRARTRINANERSLQDRNRDCTVTQGYAAPVPGYARPGLVEPTFQVELRCVVVVVLMCAQRERARRGFSTRGEQASTSLAVEKVSGVLPVSARVLNGIERRNDSRARRAQVCAIVWRSVEREGPSIPDTDKQCRVSTRGDGTACSSAMRVDWYLQRIARRLPSSGTP